MYTYEYEHIHIDIGFGLAGTESRIDGCQDMIDRRAKEGWRYVGYLPTGQRRGDGMITRMDLIFEKEIENP